MDTGPKTTLSEQMYRRLRADIVKGVLRPEQPLRLDALKKTYAAGFSPLREALTRLQAERLVTSVPLKGIVVTPVSLDQMWDTIETRILIETRALRLAIAAAGCVGIGYAASAQLIGNANGVALGHQLGRIGNVVVDEKHVAGLAAIAVEQQGDGVTGGEVGVFCMRRVMPLSVKDVVSGDQSADDSRVETAVLRLSIAHVRITPQTS